MTEAGEHTNGTLQAIKILLQILVNIVIYVLVIMASARLAMTAYDFSYQIYGEIRAEEPPGTDLPVKIKKGEGTMEIAETLVKKGVIEDKYSFFIRAKLSTGSKRPVLPGSYKLNTSMTYGEILSVLTNEATAEEEGKK